MTTNQSCSKIDKLLERYLDGELDRSEAEAVRAELVNCQPCRHRFEALQKMRALVREVYVEEVRTTDLDELLPGVMAKVEREQGTFWSRLSRWVERYRLGLASPIAPVGVAATIGVAIIAATLIYVSQTTPTTPETGTNRPAVSTTEEGHSPAGVILPGTDRGTETGTGGKVVAEGTPRRPQHREKPFRKNECYITSYDVESGIVIVDVDPDGDVPTVVWHFDDDGEDNGAEEDSRI